MDGKIMTGDNKLKFEVETKRVLQILAKDIYDSPLALLRENVQNAYDAILMEKKRSDKAFPEFEININISPTKLEIIDNGIGMSIETLQDNFWMAGSSGKNNEFAISAGVVGTFGIGAMANFGVCQKLEVFTKFSESGEEIHSWVSEDELKIGEDCISYNSSNEISASGTKIIAHLRPEVSINEAQIRNYLSQYIEFLPVKMKINGKNFEQKELCMRSIVPAGKTMSLQGTFPISFGNNKFDLDVYQIGTTEIGVVIKNLIVNVENVVGEILLCQGKPGVMGLRNSFGLAGLPLSSIFNFGGIANLSVLKPTAGREALSRESIQFVQQLINNSNGKIIEAVASIDGFADKNQSVITYINNQNRLDLAGGITIDYMPNNQTARLSELATLIEGFTPYYYKGKDQVLIKQFSCEGNILFTLSNQGAKKGVQEKYLKQIVKVPEVPDSVTITHRYKESELDLKEVSLAFRVKNVLQEDYLIHNSSIVFCDMSHGVQIQVKKNGEELEIFLARGATSTRHLFEVHDQSFEFYLAFVKDFVRNYLYSHIQNYVPSSTKQGAEALKKVLSKKRELYKYDFNELGEVESYLEDYMAGKMDMKEVFKKAKTLKNSQVQKVSSAQVGNVITEIPQIESSPSNASPEVQSGQQPVRTDNVYDASPAIHRIDVATNKKILKVDTAIKQLNNFKLFLGMSDRLVKYDYDFFLEPHSTKIIWGPHRVIYIFMHASSQLSLYYNIELTGGPIESNMGSLSILTTTLVTKDRIFVPVPDQLLSTFEINSGEKKFFVTYDVLES
jgi:molecular chaperone HtpG